MRVVLATICGLIIAALLSKAIGTDADRARWAFDLRVAEAEARSQPCLRITGPGCPRPLPLAPNYCPFPIGGTP